MSDKTKVVHYRLGTDGEYYRVVEVPKSEIIEATKLSDNNDIFIEEETPVDVENIIDAMFDRHESFR